MPKETVIVDGKKHAGFIVTDFLSAPMQVWFVFESEELQQKYGHRIAFTFTAGKPEPRDKELAAVSGSVPSDRKAFATFHL